MDQQPWVSFAVIVDFSLSPAFVSLSLQKHGCFLPSSYPSCRQTEKNSGYESFTLALKSNCIRQPKGQLPSSSYNHNTLKTLITSLIPHLVT